MSSRIELIGHIERIRPVASEHDEPSPIAVNGIIRANGEVIVGDERIAIHGMSAGELQEKIQAALDRQRLPRICKVETVKESA